MRGLYIMGVIYAVVAGTPYLMAKFLTKADEIFTGNKKQMPVRKDSGRSETGMVQPSRPPLSHENSV